MICYYRDQKNLRLKGTAHVDVEIKCSVAYDSGDGYQGLSVRVFYW